MKENKEYFQPQNKMEILSNYYQWYYKILNEYLGDKIIDLGCGKGIILNTILSNKACHLLVGVDISEENIKYNLVRDFVNSELYCEDFNDFDYTMLTTKKIDTILLLDVLEHIDKDVDFLQKVYANMLQGTKLIIKVPNAKFMFNSIDVASGHYRRYSQLELNRKCKEVGLKKISFQYMNLVGGLVYLTKKIRNNEKSTFSETYSDSSLTRINKLIPAFQFIDRINFLSFGLSGIGIYEK